MEEKELIASGAEAKLFKTEYLGKTVLVKERVPKKYRHKKLDQEIRTKRIKEEALLLHKAKELGVRTPVIYRVDREKNAIWMEYVEGEKVKDVLCKKNLWICKEIGKNIALMHECNLIHGDLTTSNMILAGKKIVFLDFGLGFNSEKTEDKAVDLLVFKKTFNATHSELEKGWEKALEGYLSSAGSKSVLERMKKVEERARYL